MKQAGEPLKIAIGDEVFVIGRCLVEGQARDPRDSALVLQLAFRRNWVEYWKAIARLAEPGKRIHWVA